MVHESAKKRRSIEKYLDSRLGNKTGRNSKERVPPFQKSAIAEKVDVSRRKAPIYKFGLKAKLISGALHDSNSADSG